MPGSEINLLFCGDRKMVKGVFLCLLTIQKFTPRPLKVFLFSMDAKWGKKVGHAITGEDVAFLDSYFSKGSYPIHFVLVDVKEGYEKELAHCQNAKTSFSPYSLLRLLAPDYISEDRLLYLDADIMTCDDLSKIYDTDLSQSEMAAIQDHIGLYWMGKGYFNSGVLLFNLALCRKSGFFEHSIHYVVSHHLFMPDQTAMNRSVKAKRMLPECFNDQQRGFREGTVIKHFSQVVKWSPFPHFAKCKQWDFEKVHDTYKTHFFDPFFEIYLKDFPFASFGEKKPERVNP
jgi:lipopolysaccharide biosynthesis glycosyltransferase